MKRMKVVRYPEAEGAILRVDRAIEIPDLCTNSLDTNAPAAVEQFHA
jgi:hypothetical protein